MKILHSLLLTAHTVRPTDFVTVNRLTEVRGIQCPKTTIEDTREAVKDGNIKFTLSALVKKQQVKKGIIDSIIYRV